MSAVKTSLEEKRIKDIESAEIELAEKARFKFDPVEHMYTLDGKPLHGVTSILRVIAKPALIQWAANMACDYIIENSPRMDTGRFTTDTIIEEARVAHRKKKEDAGEKGHDVHTQIEELVKQAIEANKGHIKYQDDGKINPQVQKFMKWADENNAHFLESEKRVYSQESWYAGTLDLVLEIDGKKFIADVKTSSAIYPEFYLQMAAYQGALEEMNEHTDIAGAMVINLPKKGGFEIGYNYAYADNRMAFLAALVLYKQLNAIGGPQKIAKTKKVINI